MDRPNRQNNINTPFAEMNIVNSPHDWPPTNRRNQFTRFLFGKSFLHSSMKIPSGKLT